MIRLLLVDDQSLICQGLKAMLSLEDDLEVVGIANDGNAAVGQVAALQPDLVLMDVRILLVDLAGRFSSIHDWHLHIHENHIGT